MVVMPMVRILAVLVTKLGELVTKNAQECSIKALLKYRTHQPNHLGELCAAGEKILMCIFDEKSCHNFVIFH